MIAAACLSACTNRENPFLTDWNTPYGIPPFQEIQVDNYIPAIQAGIEQQKKEIEDIVNNQDAPTFDNTILPLELSGEILRKVPQEQLVDELMKEIDAMVKEQEKA